MVDEHLNWKDHINIIESNLSKNLGLLRKVEQFLNAKAIKSIHFSFIHNYLTHGNVAWCSTSMNKTKRLFSKQKQARKIIPIANIYANLNSDEKMKHLDTLNIYKSCLYPILNIMFLVKTNSIQETFQNKFKVIERNYSTRYIEYNFKEPNNFLGLLNLQYRHLDNVSGIIILTNF